MGIKTPLGHSALVERLDRVAAVEVIYLFVINAQRRHQYVSRGYIRAVSLLESHILTELNANPELVASDLTRLLCVDKVFLSRALSQLESRGIISSLPHPDDKRRKNLALTSEGIEGIRSMDTAADKHMQAFCWRLSLEEQGRLRDLFDLFADALAVPASPLRRGEHHLRRGLRRFTRALYLLSDTILGVQDCSALEWHMLLTLKEANAPLSSGEISAAVPAPLPLTTSALQRFLQKGFIAQDADAADRRKLLSRLTEQGIAHLRDIAERACERIGRATADWSIEEVREFTYLFGVFATAEIPPADGVTLQDAIEVRRLSTEEDLREARIFLLRELSRAGFAGQNLPERFIDPQNLIFGLTRNLELAAVLELDVRDSSQAPIFSVASERIDQQLADRFLHEARRIGEAKI